MPIRRNGATIRLQLKQEFSEAAIIWSWFVMEAMYFTECNLTQSEVLVTFHMFKAFDIVRTLCQFTK